MEWSPQQSAALLLVRKWLKEKKAPQIFHLFGFAGVGKSELAKEIATFVNMDVAFCSFTGKACLVMRRKGCFEASTIHSTIYKPITQDDDYAGPPEFELNPDSIFALRKLVICDEMSMVNEEVGRDMLSFGTKILVLGDPMQLKPVRGTGFFNVDNPEVMLTEIHRQAADNPIIRLSMEVREGRRLRVGDYGSSKVITRATLDYPMVLRADQVLVGRNKTRRAFNERIRELKNFKKRGVPELGDKLICLKNNQKKNLLNGSVWIVSSEPIIVRNVAKMQVISDDELDDKTPLDIEVPLEFFIGTEENLHPQVRKYCDEFDFGEACTVHKFQGSQEDEIMLFDESGAFREDWNRWLYSGITRAAEDITVVI